MKDPETRWSKIRGVTVALMCLVPLGLVEVVIFLWKILGVSALLAWLTIIFFGKAVFWLLKMLCVPAKWVARAFMDLMEDETHIEKIRKQTKGG